MFGLNALFGEELLCGSGYTKMAMIVQSWTPSKVVGGHKNHRDVHQFGTHSE